MGKLHLIELKENQDVREGIYNYLTDKDFKVAAIVGGVGSIYNVEITNPINFELPPTKVGLKVEKPCEIVSFMGEIILKDMASKDTPADFLDNPSEYVVHIHMSFSHDNGLVNGGGFKNATVLRAVNVYIIEMD